MESQKTRDIEVLKTRGYGKCLRDGFAVSLKQFGVILKLSWPVALLFALLYAWFQSQSNGVIMAVMEGQAFHALVFVMGAGVLTAVAGVAFQACIVWHQRRMAELGYLPSVSIWHVWKNVLRVFFRVLVATLIELVVWLVFLGICGWVIYFSASHLLSGSAVPAWRWGVIGLECFVFFILFILLTGLVCQVFMEYLLGKGSLAEAFASLKWGRRYLGHSLLVAFVGLISFAVVWLVISLPSVVFNYIDGITLGMALEGETASLPGYYPWLRFLGWLLSGLGYCFGLLFVFFPLCFNWGAIHAIENERLEALKAEEDAKKEAK